MRAHVHVDVRGFVQALAHTPVRVDMFVRVHVRECTCKYARVHVRADVRI